MSLLQTPTEVRSIPVDWHWMRLDAACEDAVFDCPHSTPVITDDGPLMVRTQDIITGAFRSENAAHVSEETYQERIRRVEPALGDLVYSREGTYFGIAAEVPEGVRVCLGQRMVLMRPSLKHVHFRFMRYWLNSPIMARYIHGFRDGSVAERLNLPTIRALPILIPPVIEQRAIAGVLGALDDKIELNRRRNRTLEATARAIFQSWFVDFDPVKAKAAGHKPTGLSEEIAALFPSFFEDSDLGEIPKGWTARPLPEVFLVNPTRSLSKGTLAPYLDMSNMPTQGPSPDSWVIREMGSGMKFINGDTLVARITPCLENGKTAYVDFLAQGEVAWGSTEYIVLRPKGSIPPLFAYLLARTEDFRTFAIQQMTGSSGRQRVPADSLGKYRLPTPELDSPLFRHFGNLVAPMFHRIKVDAVESRTLAALRDALLPKLISGALRVPDAERIVERTV